MTRFLPYLVLCGIAAEIASIIWVGGLLGVLPTLLLMLLGAVAGIRLLKSAGTSAVAVLRSPVQGPSSLRALGSTAAAPAISGLLFLLPGFFSDCIGLLLFLPPVRRWLASRIRVETYDGTARSHRGSAKVIEAEAVDITPQGDWNRDGSP